MCYSIPGRVIAISDKRVTVDYFGEEKQALNEFVDLSLGDYIYAQGGFIINKLKPEDAEEVLKTWRELFFKLKETDLRLSRPNKTLSQIANSVRHKHLGNACCVHGIIEFSNYCQNNCLYCGIRKDNNKVQRYRMTIDEIVESAKNAVNNLGFKALVLQSGEDLFYTDEMLVEIIEKIRKECAVLLFISIGERDLEIYKKLYNAGARGVLLRFETSNPVLYSKLRPGHKLGSRIQLLVSLTKIGYLIITGSMIGLPEQTEADILEDLRLARELKAEMYSLGPFIPYPDTPLADAPKISLDEVLKYIARARILDPEAKIVVTSALQTLDKENAAKAGLMSGANSLMINLTPKEYRELYAIYPHRIGNNKEITEQIKETIELLHSLGRVPTDFDVSREKMETPIMNYGE